MEGNDTVASLCDLPPGNFLLSEYCLPPHSRIVDDQNRFTQSHPQGRGCDHQSGRNPQQGWMCGGARVVLRGPESHDQSEYSQGHKNAYRVSGLESTLPICHSGSIHKRSIIAAVLRRSRDFAPPIVGPSIRLALITSVTSRP